MLRSLFVALVLVLGACSENKCQVRTGDGLCAGSDQQASSGTGR